VLAGLCGLAMAWTYAPAVLEMVDRWKVDPRYSHGFLVPLFSGFLLWYRRDMLDRSRLRPAWWGLPLLAAGMALELAGVRYHLGWFEGASLMLALAGLCVLVGGWPALRWAWPAIAFLFFMVPLPYRIERAVGQPLQSLATKASTYVLQTIGLPAVAEGNIVLLKDDIRVNVAEACNGLGMLMMFFAYASAAALIIDRPLLDRVLIVLSAAPIAVFANILRISVTGLLYVTSGSKLAQVVYHDLAGWLMMPLALGILWLELWLLSRLFPEVQPDQGPLMPLDLTHPRPKRPAAGLG
jgi:exosortase